MRGASKNRRTSLAIAPIIEIAIYRGVLTSTIIRLIPTEPALCVNGDGRRQRNKSWRMAGHAGVASAFELLPIERRREHASRSAGKLSCSRG